MHEYQYFIKANYSNVRHLPNEQRFKELGKMWSMHKQNGGAWHHEKLGTCRFRGFFAPEKDRERLCVRDDNCCRYHKHKTDRTKRGTCKKITPTELNDHKKITQTKLNDQVKAKKKENDWIWDAGVNNPKDTEIDADPWKDKWSKTSGVSLKQS